MRCIDANLPKPTAGLWEYPGYPETPRAADDSSSESSSPVPLRSSKHHPRHNSPFSIPLDDVPLDLPNGTLPSGTQEPLTTAPHKHQSDAAQPEGTSRTDTAGNSLLHQSAADSSTEAQPCLEGQSRCQSPKSGGCACHKHSTAAANGQLQDQRSMQEHQPGTDESWAAEPSSEIAAGDAVAGKQQQQHSNEDLDGFQTPAALSTPLQIPRGSLTNAQRIADKGYRISRCGSAQRAAALPRSPFSCLTYWCLAQS